MRYINRVYQSICALLLAAGLLMSLTSCGNSSNADAESPILLNARQETVYALSEEDQCVNVTLTFDREISLQPEKADCLRITIGGERKSSFTVEAGNEPEQAVITIPVNAVTDGLIYIGPAENTKSLSVITDASGRHPAQNFTVEGTTPTGVTLSTVSAEPGKTVKSVDSRFNLRSIAWMALFENGEQIAASGLQDSELLDGYAAVHGHDFLEEREADIAEDMTSVLESAYGTEYRFSCTDNEITVEKPGSDAALDICLYQYISCSGEMAVEVQPLLQEDLVCGEAESTESQEDEEALGFKKKTASENRTPAESEQVQIESLAISKLTGAVGEDATELYQTLTITGLAMPETQIYSLYDLQELARLSYTTTGIYAMNLTDSIDGYFGFRLLPFLALCGVDTENEKLNLLYADETGTETVIPLNNCGSFLLAVSGAEKSETIRLIQSDGTAVRVKRMTIGEEAVPVNPEYGYHDHEPYLDSLDLTFTVEVYQEGAEYLGAIKTVSMTTEELENLMREHPEAVRAGYYGTIGNEEEYPYIGVGGWLDYFEGLDMTWYLTEQVGIDSWDGRAELIDRDGECYSTIEDISYFTQAEENPKSCYTMTDTGVKITGSVPMLGLIKNGAPVLKDHTHDIDGYIAYSTLNANLEAAGVSTEIGVIKNHNGPFIACFGNCDGFYGGAETETGNNCVLLRLYLK